MFNQLITNPVGAEYNTPYNQIRPGENQVNIAGNAGGSDEDAFAAFSRMFEPYVRNQSQTILDNWMQAGQDYGPQHGPGTPWWQQNVVPRQFTDQDIQNSVQGTFQRGQDAKTVGQYFGSKYDPFNMFR